MQKTTEFQGLYIPELKDMYLGVFLSAVAAQSNPSILFKDLKVTGDVESCAEKLISSIIAAMYFEIDVTEENMHTVIYDLNLMADYLSDTDRYYPDRVERTCEKLLNDAVGRIMFIDQNIPYHKPGQTMVEFKRCAVSCIRHLLHLINTMDITPDIVCKLMFTVIDHIPILIFTKRSGL